LTFANADFARNAVVEGSQLRWQFFPAVAYFLRCVNAGSLWPFRLLSVAAPDR